MIDEEKHINDIITEEDEIQIAKRLHPMIDDFIRSNYEDLNSGRFREALYTLARSCYLTGLLIDAQLIAIAEENEVKK